MIVKRILEGMKNCELKTRQQSPSVYEIVQEIKSKKDWIKVAKSSIEIIKEGTADENDIKFVMKVLSLSLPHLEELSNSELYADEMREIGKNYIRIGMIFAGLAILDRVRNFVDVSLELNIKGVYDGYLYGLVKTIKNLAQRGDTVGVVLAMEEILRCLQVDPVPENIYRALLGLYSVSSVSGGVAEVKWLTLSRVERDLTTAKLKGITLDSVVKKRQRKTKGVVEEIKPGSQKK